MIQRTNTLSAKIFENDLVISGVDESAYDLSRPLVAVLFV